MSMVLQPATRRRIRPPRPAFPNFDLVLDEWPGGPQGEALASLEASGDVVITRLPHDFIGIAIVRLRRVRFANGGVLEIHAALDFQAA